MATDVSLRFAIKLSTFKKEPGGMGDNPKSGTAEQGVPFAFLHMEQVIEITLSL